MAFQMIHMEIAYRLLKRILPISNPAEFILGSVAPDSVHMNSDYDVNMKAKSHMFEGCGRWSDTQDYQLWDCSFRLAAYHRKYCCAMESIYRSRKLLIVTTNFTLEELQNLEDTAHAWIYDRLTEMCTSVRINGENFTKAKAREKQGTTATAADKMMKVPEAESAAGHKPPFTT